IHTSVYISEDTEALRWLGGRLCDMLASAIPEQKPKLLEASQAAPKDAIVLRMMPSSLGDEGYTLDVTEQGIQIQAPTPAGLLYGVQTLGQLLQPTVSPHGIPCVRIKDQPRFQWRGLMLDCSRTFQSLDYLRKTIDRMAMYKMNVLHLHLTDDQGWRLEIKRYPELTRKGARFPEKYKQPDAYHGFYTQEDMRALVKYGQQRNVTIVPEIELPGHSLAILSCYPELPCTGGPFEIYPFFEGDHITRDIACAGNEKTFEFFENVFSEVVAVFPSAFIHIGGDEAPKDRWEACSKCQARIKEEGLKNTHELQSYFVKRIEDILTKHNRRLIGWDEILEGGLAPNASVMNWRGVENGKAAASMGHDVVMSPTTHCYFDYTYERISSEHAYSFNPIPEGLSDAQKKHIIGIQANFWSHIDRTPARTDAQLFPRLLAIAERAWSPKEQTSWPDFYRRQQQQIPILQVSGVVSYDETKP
ncbi:MAG: beta-N-acetylhexosaminidase, partial [Candidatus Hydrogenedentes bacterium]|nr:beta-N-acetylhexosaminidase [Candidatus Hydrogenedentota bacterium]